ncbi:unnamed protein product, partial [Ascophyllum nodosum]
PARFGDCGARWFVARFEGLEQSCSVFSMIRWLFGIRPVSMPRHDIKSRRRGRLEPTGTRGRNRGHGVMTTLGDWKLGANGCRGALWSDERFGANILTTTPRRGLQLSGGLR